MAKVPEWRRISLEKVLLYAAAAGSAIEAATLIWYELLRFGHFDLGIDYANFNQGTYLISRGLLYPFNTINNDYFLKDTFGLLSWLLALPRLLFPSGATLLVEQALAIAATVFFLVWIAIEQSRRLSPVFRVGVVGTTALFAFANPWALEADSFDVHLEPFAALGLVVAVWALLAGRRRWAVAGVAVALLSGSALIVTALGLGLGLLFMPRLRREGIWIAGASLVMLLADEILRAHQGFSIATSYGYLAEGTSANPSILAILEGAVLRPSVPIAAIGKQWLPITQILGYGGLLGLLFPPTLFATVLTLPMNALAQGGEFISLTQGFQNWPEVALLLAGSAVVAPELLLRLAGGWRTVVAVAGAALAAATGVGMLLFDATVPFAWIPTPGVAWAPLARTKAATPPSAEVAATINVISRFSARRDIFPVIGDPITIPVCRQQAVVVVEVGGGYAAMTLAQVQAEARGLLAARGARVLANAGGVVAVDFGNLRPGSQVIELPSGTVVGGSGAAAIDAARCVGTAAAS